MILLFPSKSCQRDEFSIELMELVLSVNRDRKRRNITDSLLLMDGISWITNLSTKFLKLQKDFQSVRNTCFSCSARVHEGKNHWYKTSISFLSWGQSSTSIQSSYKMLDNIEKYVGFLYYKYQLRNLKELVDLFVMNICFMFQFSCIIHYKYDFFPVLDI